MAFKKEKCVKAIIVVHVLKNMENRGKIIEIEKYNFKVLEDATEALGTFYTEEKYAKPINIK